MDLPQIGAHCAQHNCNALDFLPITCHCAKAFCSQHFPADQHACPLLNANVKSDLPVFSDQLPRCALNDCDKLCLRISGESCAACHKSFCVDHRHPDTHQCPSVVIKTEEFKSKASLYTTKPFKLATRKPPTDSAKLAQWQKMEVMKMRHRASPADPKDKSASLPPDQRLHVRLMVDEKEHIFWFRKTVVTGRALDLAVQQLKLSFPGNPPLNFHLLFQAEEGRDTPLQNDQVLANQVIDGCTLFISST
ncbi:hypothetical protein BDN70DRAFT_883851 [Pholiota conissans]|uniref:AN1-type domain-containing protein n=1 Tax=Pholiota conissans TaxID=109636 RepID=A0A9P5YUE3_9AGAR|nr:hypothetical protein BDN70DRAFT_883851 [Pholiota conissans]